MAANVQQIQQPGAAYQVPRQQQYLMPGQRQQQPQQPQGDKKKIAGNCFLCNRTGHLFTNCFTYRNMVPGSVICSQCGGRHPVQCKKKTSQNDPSNRYSGGSKNVQGPPPYSSNSGGPQQFQMGQRLGNGGRQAHPAN